MTRIDTAEAFAKFVAKLEPVYVTSSTRGPILVPCMNTVLVKRELVVANTWNPNSVSEDKMQLLAQSIMDNGFCFPIVTIWSEEDGKFIIIDGFHRRTIGGADWLDLDYVPVVVLKHDLSKRMVATIQFNKARGHHQVDLDAEVIRSLIGQGMTEEQVAEHLGIDLDTVHRYKQLTGVAELFANAEWSGAWEMSDG